MCGQDLNRVKDKPYTAAVEDDGRPDHVSNLCVRVCVHMCNVNLALHVKSGIHGGVPQVPKSRSSLLRTQRAIKDSIFIPPPPPPDTCFIAKGGGGDVRITVSRFCLDDTFWKGQCFVCNLVWWCISMSLGPNLTDCELWMPAMHEIQGVYVYMRMHLRMCPYRRWFLSG